MTERSKIKIYGASDDCIEFEGAFDEEFYVYPEGSSNTIRSSFVIGGVLRVLPFYHEGCWSFAVGQVHENFPVPEDWEISIGFDSDVCGYSSIVYLSTPTKVSVVREELNDND